MLIQTSLPVLESRFRRAFWPSSGSIAGSAGRQIGRNDLMPTTITNIIVRDIRFPTSATLDGSDAVNIDPDYSATYVILQTDSPQGLRGYGLAFTNGRGTEVCVAAVDARKQPVNGRNVKQLAAKLAAIENAA